MASIIPVNNIDVNIVIKVQKSLYTKDIIEAAVIPLMDITTVSFKATTEHIEVTFVLDEYSIDSAQDVEKAFLNNLIHESLRKKIAESTEIERNLILAHAFSNSKLMVSQ